MDDKPTINNKKEIMPFMNLISRISPMEKSFNVRMNPYDKNKMLIKGALSKSAYPGSPLDLSNIVSIYGNKINLQ